MVQNYYDWLPPLRKAMYTNELNANLDLFTQMSSFMFSQNVFIQILIRSIEHVRRNMMQIPFMVCDVCNKNYSTYIGLNKHEVVMYVGNNNQNFNHDVSSLVNE